MEINEADLPRVEGTEAIKLTKNTKGMNWDIKVFPQGDSDDDWLNRLERLNLEMERRFGNQRI